MSDRSSPREIFVEIYLLHLLIVSLEPVVLPEIIKPSRTLSCISEKHFKSYSCWALQASYETMYSKMEVIYGLFKQTIISFQIFVRAVFHKLYLAHPWIRCLICNYTNEILMIQRKIFTWIYFLRPWIKLSITSNY